MVSTRVIVHYNEDITRESKEIIQKEIRGYITDQLEGVSVESFEQINLSRPYQVVLTVNYDTTRLTKEEVIYDLSTARFIHNTQLE